MRTVLLLPLLFATFAAIQAAPTTVAVLYFNNNSLMDKDKYEGLRKGLCDMMITELSKVSQLKVVEREELEKIMQEIALGQTGAVDEAGAARVGKLLGAQALLLGSFMKDMGSDIRIDMRLVKVETGEVLQAEEVSGATKQILKLIKKLVFKVIDRLSVDLSGGEKKSIQGTKDVGFEALVIYSLGLDLLDKGDRHGALKKFEEAVTLDSSFERARAQVRRLQAEGVK